MKRTIVEYEDCSKCKGNGTVIGTTFGGLREKCDICCGKGRVIKKEEMGNEVPKGWRKGQFIFNFLEWLRIRQAGQGIFTECGGRMADPFHISDEEWDSRIEEYINQLK
ncbi:MAG: hypothetical protein KJI69_05030 [Patescibacteria group bacterium]|nr:hypothetical protein [Patescibacteria group bacterium]